MPWSKCAASILLVDSDDFTRRSLGEWLLPRGYDFSCVATAEAAATQLEHVKFDLIVLSLLLPDRDGLSVCRELCRQRTTPVIMIGEPGTSFDEVASLEAGADDFLAKPLRREVTLARVTSLLRRCHRASSQDTLRVGDLQIDRPRMQALREGTNLQLTPTELKLLTQLAMRPGSPLSRDSLLSNIWNTDYLADRRLVDTHVRNLRRKLRQAGSSMSIHGVRGVGYRLSSALKGTPNGAATESC